MRKIFIVLSVIILFCSYAGIVSAEQINAVINIENYNVTVSGELGESAANHMVTLVVLKPGSSLSDISGITEGFSDKISDFAVTYADGEGCYRFDDFQISGSSGEYVLAVAADNGEIFSIVRYIPSKTQFDAIITVCSEGSGNEIYDILRENEEEVLKVSDISLYYSLSDSVQRAICEKLTEDRPYSSLKEITSAIMRETAIYELAHTTSEGKLYEYLYPDESNFGEEFKIIVNDILNFEDKKKISVIGDFDTLEKEKKLKVLSLLAKMDRTSDFYGNLEISMINMLIDSVSNWSEIEAYIKKYSEDVLTELDYDKYLKSDKKTAIEKSLMGKQFKTVGELCEYINNYKNESSGQTGGGFGKQIGKTSGANGGGSSVVPILPETKKKSIFSDTEGIDWAKNEIYYLYENGIVSGDGNGLFFPDRNVTREEFVKMVVMAKKLEKTADYYFEDVDLGHWAYPYIMAAVSAGIIKGLSEKTFGTGKYITREDMAVIASRILKNDNDEINAGSSFSDDDEISDYAIGNVHLMSQKGIIKGFDDGSFRPGSLATRAETAVIVYRLIQRLKNAD